MSSSFVLTRRRLVQQGSTVALTGMVGGRLRHRTSTLDYAPESVRDAGKGTADPDLIRALAMKSLDAARAAGATYADVRITRTVQENLEAEGRTEGWRVDDQEHLAIGVRALVRGYWGFAATPYWTADEAVRVGTMAAAEAANLAKGPSRSFAFDAVPVVTGTWQTPIVIDPFRISTEEKLDYLRATVVATRRLIPDYFGIGRIPPDPMTAMFVRQECALATSEGSYVTQTLYQASGELVIGSPKGAAFAKGLLQVGKGWELLTEAKLLDQIPGMVEEAESKARLPLRPVQIGRNTIVCDALTMAGVLDATLGRATEVDRALGYEANASGTSYLGPDPLTLLGTVVANPMITITANRSLPTGLATVKWDAECHTPQDFPLVRAGTLVDYQTTREQAAWLAPWYQKAGTPVQSHGCAAAENAMYLPMQMTPNLALTPAASSAGFEELLAGVTDGLAVEGGDTAADFQCRSGRIVGGGIYQVKQGKRVAQLVRAGVLFDAPAFWKNVTAIGGAASVVHAPGRESKGEPSQTTTHTVSSVPAVITEMSIYDLGRKA